jgi:2-oxoglutarate dehydrogenase E1 component
MDEFISSGEQKWGQRSSLTLLLPHGYEGQGPDHSSARIERYLQMCAQDNMTVAYPTSPANYFHLLRWQVRSGRRKPLIVFTPKSLLRHKAATSATAEFTSGQFQPVIPDGATLDPAGVRKVLFTTGKIYYDVVARREAVGATDTAVVRVERLYPPPIDEIKAELTKYPSDAEMIWVQDEPKNMGAWPFFGLVLPQHFQGRVLSQVSRRASSSPAVGSAKLHQAEQEDMLVRLFGEV